MIWLTASLACLLGLVTLLYVCTWRNCRMLDREYEAALVDQMRTEASLVDAYTRIDALELALTAATTMSAADTPAKSAKSGDRRPVRL